MVEAHVVDVWLNIVCPVREYEARASEKLESGIATATASVSPGW
jgi:hypothetical protein